MLALSVTQRFGGIVGDDHLVPDLAQDVVSG
jgi:hypothetical protein